jgi:prepilin-type N-terminal cleavage/methylation domain-containing protein/prepilin-type processing-associated H-X9-DG protein
MQPREIDRHGFSLVELLVVMGIVAILLGLLLPTVSSAITQSQAITCESNVRQICMGLSQYAADNQQHYPPNLSSPAPGQFWYDPDRIGHYLAITNAVGGVLICPKDENAVRSYSMNVWASCQADQTFVKASSARGTLWNTGSRNSSSMILITEKWSTNGSSAGGWQAPPTIGFLGFTPGQRFGSGGGLSPLFNAGRFGLVNSELPFLRHRSSRVNGMGTQAVGQITIGYADGHVALRGDYELANANSGLSTLDSLWSPLDPSLNR